MSYTPEHLPKELKQHIFEVTQAVYRVTGLFPYSEPLRYEIRREASEILKKSAQYSILPDISFHEVMEIVGRIHGLQSLFLLARWNKFVHSLNIEVLEREYKVIEDFFMREIRGAREKDQKALADTVFVKGESPKNQKPEKQPSPEIRESKIERSRSGDEERKKVIINFLSKKDRSSIKDIADVLKDISTKTIQRDLNALIEMNMVERTGDRRWAVYSLKQSFPQVLEKSAR